MRVDLDVDGKKLPLRLAPDGEGRWRVEPADRVAAPRVAESDPAKPTSKLRELWDRAKGRGHEAIPQHPLGSGQNADLYGQIGGGVEAGLHLPTVDTGWDPAFFTLQVLKFKPSNIERFVHLVTGTVSDKVHNPPAALDRAGREYEYWRDFDPEQRRKFDVEMKRLGLDTRFDPPAEQRPVVATSQPPGERPGAERDVAAPRQHEQR